MVSSDWFTDRNSHVTLKTPQKDLRPTLGTICAVTFTVPDLSAIERAYVNELGYKVAARNHISAAQAGSWGAPAVAGFTALLLAPASGEAAYLRFIEDAGAAGWTALTSFGWNVTEFVVQDVDALAARLAGGDFEIIGPPQPLTRFPMIRAMQAIGPAGECCYFTQIGAGSGLKLGEARSFVGRVFIVVAAGPDADALFVPYSAFANAVDPPVATPVRVISRAHGLPASTLHRHGLVRLPEGTLIELDQYPASTRRRECALGKLPPGMAVVTFAVESLAGQSFIAAPVDCELPGIEGLSACLRGATGELIEIVAAHGSSATKSRP
jgi:catechol 2,3-dioxygenase-like lactoylglutathione lyase family enzyme